MTAIAYAYDVPLPNAYAATLQILRTGAALRREGHCLTLFCGPCASGVSDLSRYGVEAAAAPAIVPLFPRWPRSEPLRHAARRLALAGLARRIGGRADLLMARGPTARAAATLRWPVPLVVEMHRLEWVAANEALAGRRLGPRAAPLNAAVARLRAAERRTLAAADGIVFLGPALEAAARESLGPFAAPTILAPSGVAAPAVAAPLETAEWRARPHDLVFLGKAERRKGLGTAIAMLDHLPGRTLLVLGDGPDLEAARQQARASGLLPRIAFAGRVPAAEVPLRLASARIGLCVLPGLLDSVSAEYSSPMKLLDFMAAGLPVVASDLPSVRAVAGEGRALRLAPADDPAALATAAEALLADPATAAAQAAAARDVARAHDWSVRAAAIGEFATRIRCRRAAR